MDIVGTGISVARSSPPGAVGRRLAHARACPPDVNITRNEFAQDWPLIRVYWPKASDTKNSPPGFATTPVLLARPFKIRGQIISLEKTRSPAPRTDAIDPFSDIPSGHPRARLSPRPSLDSSLRCRGCKNLRSIPGAFARVGCNL
jgi:hypothetical protein